MKRFFSHSLVCLAVSTALPVMASDSFIGSNTDPSLNNVNNDITIDANRVLTYNNSDGTKDYALFGIFPNGQSVSFTGKNITLNVLASGLDHSQSRESLQSSAIDALGGSRLILGSKNSNVTFNINSDASIMGIRSGAESNVEVNGESLVMNAESFGTTPETGSIYGLYAQNSTNNPDLSDEERATLIVNSENAYINVKSAVEGQAAALVAMSQGILKVNGNLYATGDKAIVARGGAVVRINESNTKTVQLTGDIDFNYDKKTSGTSVDADVLVNLNGEDSFWHGSATVSYGSGSTSDDMLKVSGLKLGISNGAHWTPTLVEEYEDESTGVTQVAVNDVTLNNGKIILEHGQQQTLKIENLHGEGGTFNMVTSANEDGFSTANVEISNVDEASAPELTVKYTGITADDLVNQQISDIQGGLNAQGATQTRVVEQGAVKGTLVETIGADGKSQGVKQYDNTRLTAYGSVAALGVLQWRHDMNDLTKRMGELRTSPEGVGTWARLYGSEQEYGGQGITSKNTSIQVGADFDVGAGWKVGAAFTYTDGNATYDLGDADNKAYGLAIYGTWFADNGQFVDLIAKYSRLDTDFNLEGMDGSFDNNAYSVSAEYGWHLKLGELAFVEPQVELTYGIVSGDDFTTGNDVRIEQDDFDSLIGRVGFRTGFLFPENKGTIYARASVLHDFQGELDSKASLVSDSSVSDDINDDLGGTWYEFGIGANFNLTDRTYTYVDLEKNTGGEVKENWRWNVGLRHVF